MFPPFSGDNTEDKRVQRWQIQWYSGIPIVFPSNAWRVSRVSILAMFHKILLEYCKYHCITLPEFSQWIPHSKHEKSHSGQQLFLQARTPWSNQVRTTATNMQRMKHVGRSFFQQESSYNRLLSKNICIVPPCSPSAPRFPFVGSWILFLALNDQTVCQNHNTSD